MWLLRGIWPAVSISKLFAILIAAAMLFAPFAMQSGSAMAAMASDHHAQMAVKGHCGGQPATDKDSPPAEKSCCVAMCTGIAVAPAAAMEPHVFVQTDPATTPQDFQFGFFGELPTPPPRVA